MNVLLIENKQAAADVVVAMLALGATGKAVKQCKTLDEAKAAVSAFAPDVIVADRGLLPDTFGPLGHVPIVLFTSDSFIDNADFWVKHADIMNEATEAAAARKGTLSRINNIMASMECRIKQMNETEAAIRESAGNSGSHTLVDAVKGSAHAQGD